MPESNISKNENFSYLEIQKETEQIFILKKLSWDTLLSSAAVKILKQEVNFFKGFSSRKFL